ncbi:hpcH/HpaI aldolase/citrate lyase family domain-containing protein [Trichoderma breve]|uniref:HpcH/HpaI aldolase/citrate lyase family domain-containing protein n=1 Tax=Trichoderma breve TaxID=2034170 RepID=A0A9W9BJ87_9HYPO|nr:hpcH/HpaI aldolase/citrate lyase family domain-containing protein [Trichoderma breve]KAJ4860531.1 hpcH/HpaI aldolase/citrate lyase family domain-containing protein [Trichoderma breve]
MAARASSILRRSLLYVPASSQKMLSKSLALTTDNVTYDLEDSVTPSQKGNARNQLKEHISTLKSRPSTISELAVRINAVSTPFALDDLTTLSSADQVDAIVVPKVNSAADLTFVTDVLRHVAPEPQAVMDLSSICKASPFLSGLIFAAEDFALDLSITRTPSLTEFLYARSAIVTAARAHNLPSAIDLVCTSYRGDDGLRTLEEECQGGKAMGFNGKQCIHPGQLETVQRMFAPDIKDVEWAVRVTIADEKAATAGRGAWTLDGKMIDAPVVGKAHAITAKAEQCGIDVQDLRAKWKDQEPE